MQLNNNLNIPGPIQAGDLLLHIMPLSTYFLHASLLSIVEYMLKCGGGKKYKN